LQRAAIVYARLQAYDDLSFVIGNGMEYFGPVAYYLGIIDAALGRNDAAAARFDAAHAATERMRARPWVALVRYEWAKTLAGRRGAGDAERARALVASAVSTAHELGMQLLARRAETLAAELRTFALPSAADAGATPALQAIQPNVFRKEG